MCRVARMGIGFGVVVAVVAVFPGGLSGDVFRVDNATAVQNAMNLAVDGDEILLAPGTYVARFAATGITGVHIRSADPTNPAIISPGPFGEAFKLSSVERVTLSDMVIESASVNGINIDDGGHVEFSRDVTLRNLTLRNGGQHGIRLTGVDGFTIDRVQMHGWGNGWAGVNMIGAHNGTIENSVWENEPSTGGFGMKIGGGSSGVTIRANRFVNAGERAIQFGAGLSPSIFRPQPPGNVSASDLLAEGNVIEFSGNAASGIHVAFMFSETNDSIFRHNYVYRPSIFVARILKEQSSPDFVLTQNGRISDNVIVWRQGDVSSAVNVGPNTLPGTFHFEGNWWYNETNPANSQLSLPAPETDGVYGIDPNLSADAIIPWEFDWGMWLVNANSRSNEISIDTIDGLVTAFPGEDAMMDLTSDLPLGGDWEFSPLTTTTLVLGPLSDVLIVDPAKASPLSADFTLDGIVDRRDVEVWRQNVGDLANAIKTTGDSDGDRDVDGDDLLQLLLQFGSQVQQFTPGGVPEPSTVVLAGIGLAGMLLILRPAAGRTRTCLLRQAQGTDSL